jgi:hypothetical protein
VRAVVGDADAPIVFDQLRNEERGRVRVEFRDLQNLFGDARGRRAAAARTQKRDRLPDAWAVGDECALILHGARL